MSSQITDQIPDSFTLIRPVNSSTQWAKSTRQVPVIASIPHSGLHVPSEIAESFTPQHLRSLPNSDWHLQPLYDFLPKLGVTVLQANYSRYVVDLNRALKPPLFGSFWSAVVPARTAFKQRIYQEGRLPNRENIQARIEKYYQPYHRQLQRLLDEAIAQCGKVCLLDLHSFMGLVEEDVCLGNARGKTCSENIINSATESFIRSGYSTVQNKVFTGGFITRHYGLQPDVEALQIELRYPTYLPSDQIAEPVSKNGEAQLPITIPHYSSSTFTQAQIKLESVFARILSTLA